MGVIFTGNAVLFSDSDKVAMADDCCCSNGPEPPNSCADCGFDICEFCTTPDGELITVPNFFHLQFSGITNLLNQCCATALSPSPASRKITAWNFTNSVTVVKDGCHTWTADAGTIDYDTWTSSDCTGSPTSHSTSVIAYVTVDGNQIESGAYCEDGAGYIFRKISEDFDCILDGLILSNEYTGPCAPDLSGAPFAYGGTVTIDAGDQHSNNCDACGLCTPNCVLLTFEDHPTAVYNNNWILYHKEVDACHWRRDFDLGNGHSVRFVVQKDAGVSYRVRVYEDGVPAYTYAWGSADQDCTTQSSDTIGGVTITVTPCETDCCQFALDPESAEYNNLQHIGNTVDLETGATTPWTAVSDSAWITITSATSGTGPATITYDVDANVLVGQRVGHITVDCAVLTITQGVNCSAFLAGSSCSIDGFDHESTFDSSGCDNAGVFFAVNPWDGVFDTYFGNCVWVNTYPSSQLDYIESPDKVVIAHSDTNSSLSYDVGNNQWVLLLSDGGGGTIWSGTKTTGLDPSGTYTGGAGCSGGPSSLTVTFNP